MKTFVAFFILIGAPFFSSASSSYSPSPDEQVAHGSSYRPMESNHVDLHKQDFCVDVSTYGPVQYDKKAVKVCDSTFRKNCRDRSEEVGPIFKYSHIQCSQYYFMTFTSLEYLLLF